MNKENYFISLFNNIHIGDDGALVPSVENMVISKDAFFENVHFKSSWMSYYQIAQKAMIVNISDAIAMNARAKYVLLSVAMPKSITKEQMQDLAKGFQETAKRYGAVIIGGDTISNTKLDITITVISSAPRPLKRLGLKKGHILAYTGKLGSSAKDLKRLFNGGTIHKNSKFVNVVLKEHFVATTTKLLSVGMDISDGLFSDLEKLSKINKLGFTFTKNIDKKMACSGEEYEMLVAFDKRHTKAVIRRASQTRTRVNIFAKATRTKYSNRCKLHHF